VPARLHGCNCGRSNYTRSTTQHTRNNAIGLLKYDIAKLSRNSLDYMFTIIARHAPPASMERIFLQLAVLCCIIALYLLRSIRKYRERQVNHREFGGVGRNVPTNKNKGG
jgi:hypothetical protein